MILKFTTRRTKVINVKERVRQTGKNVKISGDDGKCFAEAASIARGNLHTRAPRTPGKITQMPREKMIYWTKLQL